MKISELIKATNAKILSGYDEDLEVRVSTDTRTIEAGDFYIPLKGGSFDGENFICQALEKGAIGTFCTKECKYNNAIVLQVEDTLRAYQELANYRRKQLDCTVVAITGSSGKTTTKEIVASTLEQSFKIFKTPLNHNNDVGFCQTLFSTPDDTEVLILEMGMRGLGQVERLSKYAEPDITIISNVGTAHIGLLGSKENIAKAKCEIVKYQRGKYFIAHNDELIKKTVNFNGEKIFYDINDTTILEKTAQYSKFEYKNEIYELNVGGDYNIENALAAINTGLKLGMTTEDIKSGLKNYKPIEKRWEVIKAGGYEIINDSYNANPDSMKAFVDTIFELYRDYVLVLGDMGELGKNEVQYHEELGKYIFSKNPNAKIITIGKLSENISKYSHGIHFPTIEMGVKFIKNNIPKTSKLFLKASRSMRFEKIIECLD